MLFEDLFYPGNPARRQQVSDVFAVTENDVVLASFERVRGGIEKTACMSDSPLGFPTSNRPPFNQRGARVV